MEESHLYEEKKKSDNSVVGPRADLISGKRKKRGFYDLSDPR